MSKKTIRTLLSVLAIGSALAVLLVVTMRGDAMYAKDVNEVMPVADQWYGKYLQLHGYVVPGSIARKGSTLEYRFDVKQGDSVVRTFYTGALPDSFKDHAEVVMKGRLSPAGFQVEKDGIMAKCPSKYEPGAKYPTTEEPLKGTEY